MDHTPDDVSAALLGVVETVRRMPPGRLRSAGRVAAARALAEALATALQGLEEAGSAAPPKWRELPGVPDLVIGDQLAVLAHDFQLAVAAGAPADVWTPSGRAPLGTALAELLAMITETSRVL